jgi:hypothetical protein
MISIGSTWWKCPECGNKLVVDGTELSTTRIGISERKRKK